MSTALAESATDREATVTERMCRACRYWELNPDSASAVWCVARGRQPGLWGACVLADDNQPGPLVIVGPESDLHVLETYEEFGCAAW